MTEASMEMARRTVTPPKKEEGRPSEMKNNKEEEQEGVDQVLAVGLRKLYDPILEEQVPPEMLEILRRGRKRD